MLYFSTLFSFELCLATLIASPASYKPSSYYFPSKTFVSCHIRYSNKNQINNLSLKSFPPAAAQQNKRLSPVGWVVWVGGLAHRVVTSSSYVKLVCDSPYLKCFKFNTKVFGILRLHKVQLKYKSNTCYIINFVKKKTI